MADEAERQSDVEEETVEETVEAAVEDEETVEAAEEEEKTVEAADEEQDFIRVAGSEDGDPMEFPKEADNTVTFSTVQAQFPKATGLKYRSASGAWRAIRDVDNVLAAPKEGWGNTLYIISVPDDAETEKSETRKRKAESTTKESGESEAKQKVKDGSDDDKLTKDLPVTSLPYSCTEQQLKEYFETNYGELDYCQIKTEPGTKKSRGFGFIRFKDAETAREALANQHRINGRTFFVRMKVDKPMKLFVGRLPNELTEDELREYFEQFGSIDNLWLSKPYKNFAFVTYSNKHDAIKVLRKDHELKGKKLNVDESKERESSDRDRDLDRGKGGYRNNTQAGSRYDRNDRGGNGRSSSGGGGGRYNDRPVQNQNNNLGGGGGGGLQLGGNVLEQLILASYLGGARY